MSCYSVKPEIELVLNVGEADHERILEIMGNAINLIQQALNEQSQVKISDIRLGSVIAKKL